MATILADAESSGASWRGTDESDPQWDGRESGSAKTAVVSPRTWSLMSGLRSSGIAEQHAAAGSPKYN